MIHFVLQKGKKKKERKLWMLGDIAQGERRLIMINSNEAENYSSETFWARQGGCVLFFSLFFLTRRKTQVQTTPKVARCVLSNGRERAFAEKFAASNGTLSLAPASASPPVISS